MKKHNQLEYELLRRRCAELKAAGWKQLKIAEALGLTGGWVSRTLKKYREEGKDGLQWRKPKGPTARLTDADLEKLIEELNKGVDHHGFSGKSWTRLQINEVIKKMFDVSYDPSQISRLLKRAGWDGSRTNRQPLRRKRQVSN